MKTCIVIPVYTESIKKEEAIALSQCVSLLGDYDIFFCEPESLDSSNIRKNYSSIKVEKFNNAFFKGILGYNKLMLSHEFYHRFQEYDYMLLHQLDAFVFKNELDFWCNKGYDYIGSPWLASKPNLFKKIKKAFKPKIKQKREDIFFKVGNGGFSLRKISSFLKNIENHKAIIDNELNRDTKDYRLMEDVFWSIKIPTLDQNFSIPTYDEAVFFSIDRRPKIGFKLTNNQLPFGCHGFNKKNVFDFWKNVIPGLKEI